jgi:hypothetical protein
MSVSVLSLDLECERSALDRVYRFIGERFFMVMPSRQGLAGRLEYRSRAPSGPASVAERPADPSDLEAEACWGCGARLRHRECLSTSAEFAPTAEVVPAVAVSRLETVPAAPLLVVLGAVTASVSVDPLEE